MIIPRAVATFEDLDGFQWDFCIALCRSGERGYCSYAKRRVVISPGMSMRGAMRVAFHEWFHCCFPAADESVVEFMESVFAARLKQASSFVVANAFWGASAAAAETIAGVAPVLCNASQDEARKATRAFMLTAERGYQEYGEPTAIWEDHNSISSGQVPVPVPRGLGAEPQRVP